MKRPVLTIVAIVLLLPACAPASTPTQSPAPTARPTEPLPPTEIPATPTDTPAPTPTAVPGSEVLSTESLGAEIPWLPLDESRRPMSVYYNFNLSKEPFDDVLVRKAFAAATDREAIVAFVANYQFNEAEPATTITPSQVLGRDLYGDVGIPFDPTQAQAYLEEAGFSGGEGFPTVHVLGYQRGEAAPSSYYRLATDVLAPMWEEHLGVTVEVEAFPQRILQYPAKVDAAQPDLFILGWGADFVDPDNFLRELFHTGNDWNLSGYHNSDFDSLVEGAANLADPTERQLLYIEAESILTEQDVAVLPLFHSLFYVGE